MIYSLPRRPRRRSQPAGETSHVRSPLFISSCARKRHKSTSNVLIATERREVIGDAGNRRRLMGGDNAAGFHKTHNGRHPCRLLLCSISRTSDKICFSRTSKRKQTLKINVGKLLLLLLWHQIHSDQRHLEAIQGHEQPQDVVGALEDPEDSQIPHHSLHSGILQTHFDLTDLSQERHPTKTRAFSSTPL